MLSRSSMNAKRQLKIQRGVYLLPRQSAQMRLRLANLLIKTLVFEYKKRIIHRKKQSKILLRNITNTGTNGKMVLTFTGLHKSQQRRIFVWAKNQVDQLDTARMGENILIILFLNLSNYEIQSWRQFNNIQLK